MSVMGDGGPRLYDHLLVCLVVLSITSCHATGAAWQLPHHGNTQTPLIAELVPYLMPGLRSLLQVAALHACEPNGQLLEDDQRTLEMCAASE